MFRWTLLVGGGVPVSHFSMNSNLRGSTGPSFFQDLCWVIFDLKPTGLFLRPVCAGILAAAGDLKRCPSGWAHDNAPDLRLSKGRPPCCVLPLSDLTQGSTQAETATRDPWGPQQAGERALVPGEGLGLRTKQERVMAVWGEHEGDRA